MSCDWTGKTTFIAVERVVTIRRRCHPLHPEVGRLVMSACGRLSVHLPLCERGAARVFPDFREFAGSAFHRAVFCVVHAGQFDDHIAAHRLCD